ncbi:putative leucine-rich repeat-containing, plant-type, leucine-rich repeat domain, L [Rosa chinensis]|uniref:Cell wall hydroxyproline-rich glycoprotein n=1 Tax=Rosa chinensis TaxID=74649 RepID=A0A2P6RK00_ROSCH|nr:leucine-rich repeat extensin-like protein 4 [Rosa chinensis]PRQ46737.1 putative leucine-rich repeat-containing, plant-type, leucine-rich repeat domain, L [Rosa chinensis]
MKCWLLAFMLLHIIPTEAGFGVGGGVGVSVGPVGVGGGGSVWIGGGINGQNPPSGSSSSDLGRAYTALQAWKSAISDDPTKVLDTWVGPDVCSYKGVFCADSEDGQTFVAGIDLNHANLKGILVKELSFLTEMSLIHLNSNRFSGTIPDTFTDLNSLQELDLSNNQFSGPFPTTTLYIPNLIYLDLRFNNFTGSIPDELFNKNLDAIFLNNNQFEGELPQSLGNAQASVINLANNKFSGNFPSNFGFIGTKLKEILFLNNQLTGCIPEGVGLFSEIQVFDVSFNSLAGHLPDTISCLQEIEVLNLAHNKLSGVLPDLVCSLKSLVNLTVAYNFFSGFSQECAKLYYRNVGFDFSLNCIPGKNMQRPQPQCSLIPGGGLNCLRIPGAKPLVCGSVLPSSSPSSSSSP